MARTVPTTELTSARAGDTWEWTKTFADFPATTWTLTYTFFNSTAVFTVVASADGSDHAVDVAPATTAAYTAGRYDWVAHVSDGTDKHQVGKGAIQVMPDLSSASSYDGRSHARKMLDGINAMLEGRATNEQIDIVRVGLNGRDIQKNPELLLKYRQQYAAAVKAEDDAIALANGQASGRFLSVRFTG